MMPNGIFGLEGLKRMGNILKDSYVVFINNFFSCILQRRLLSDTSSYIGKPDCYYLIYFVINLQ